MSRWRYLRWWLAAFMAALLSFLSLWLPALFVSDGSVGCMGYGPLPSGLAALWSQVEAVWWEFRLQVQTPLRWYLLNALPMVSVLLSGVAASLPGRRLGTFTGVIAAVLVAAVTLHWTFMAFSYFLMADCTGWEARLLPSMAWLVLMVLGYGCAAVLLIAGVRVRRATMRVTEPRDRPAAGRS
ncbi:hypothetical protein [Nonomuraea rubra]|uniref:hypothetical protein n=1 Tax=Nonomuraea rubra TaxID=46180 RepID=UPI00340CD6B5